MFGGSDAVLAASRRSAAEGLDRWGSIGGTKRPREVEEFSVYLSVASARSAYPVESRQAVKTGHNDVMLGDVSNEWRGASNTRHSIYMALERIEKVTLVRGWSGPPYKEPYSHMSCRRGLADASGANQE